MLGESVKTDMPTATVLNVSISDETAMIKARRFMDNLKSYSDLGNWAATSQRLGLNGQGTPKKAWETILRFNKTRKDSLVYCTDKTGNMAPASNPRKVSFVHVVNLLASGPAGLADDGSIVEYGLWLANLTFTRSRVLRPRYGDSQPDVASLLKITMHSLQRIFQRGYGLTEDGELDYMHLTRLTVWLWQECVERYEGLPGSVDQITISASEAKFVVSRTGSEPMSPMTLITVLPARK